MAGNFAQGPFCKPLARKFPRNSPPCRVPRQIPDTLSHSPHLHHPPPPIIPETTTWGKCLSPNTQTVSQAISVLATALRTAISSCYLLSAAIWRYLSTGRPCLSPVCNNLQPQIATTPPVTFKASPSAPFSPLITHHTHTQTFNLEGWLV